MKTGILTYHTAYNFGAQLQAYALRTTLGTMCDAEIIPYAPLFIARTYAYLPYQADVRRHIKIDPILMLKRGLKKLPSLGDHLHRRRKMRRFGNEYLMVRGRTLTHAKDFARLDYDRYILGSDQIWNPDFGNGFDPIYFGKFPKKDGAKCIAYGASFGREALEPQWEPEFASLLQNIDVISLREKSALPFVALHTKKPICTVPDPVFLLERVQWEHLAASIPITRNYIIVYCTEHNPNVYEYARQLAVEHHCIVLDLALYRQNHFEYCQTESRADPLEFLGLIKNAHAIVSNSFHGMALSILLQKDFYIFPHSHLHARLRDILEELQLQGRDVTSPDYHPDQTINWQEVQSRLKLMRQRGIDFLRASFKP